MTGPETLDAAFESLDASPVSEALQSRYRAYRIEQGRALLGLVPREGLRALVRAAGVGSSSDGQASLDALAAYCADRLPLPPLPVWARDFAAHREAHIADAPLLEAGPRSPNGAPVAVAVRGFRSAGVERVARLVVRPRGDDWEGAVEFPTPGDGRATRTAPVFREATVPAIRNRFDSFDDRTLEAFLRSTLP
ncbi:MAG: hypothetical protein KJO11_05915 [Gemmatimonadetes bacterium]|nr:hypothetical protein [Gemmatimonadota bacterium]MBT8403477.1 hypothetical protein [Gemmatimonadota bacterium]NNF38324.1 hypothetical protein [Gemmatimonadota bacterium]NNK64497.1 hypothetical protein [Gemmatimonadota bacterium]